MPSHEDNATPLASLIFGERAGLPDGRARACLAACEGVPTASLSPGLLASLLAGAKEAGATENGAAPIETT